MKPILVVYEKTKEEKAAYMREYRTRNQERLRAYNRTYNSKWRLTNGFHNEEKWKTKHPKEMHAEYLARKAIQEGRLKKRPCEVCGTRKNVHAHHDDYDKPLQVRFLCAAHHKQHHLALRKNASKAM